MLNNVTLIGYLGSDAQSHTTCNDATLTVLSVATKRPLKNRQSGERESQTTWHKCVSFGRTAEYAATFIKGTHVQIVGEIQKLPIHSQSWRQEVGHRDPRTPHCSFESIAL
jgi:single-strand DNA-binding protein